MNKPSPEQERLRQLRDRQLRARDPMTKQHRLERTIAQRHRRAQEPFSMVRIWSEIPHKWKGVFYGLVGGALLLVVLPMFWSSPWATLLPIILIPFFVFLGFLFGRAADVRDELNDLMR